MARRVGSRSDIGRRRQTSTRRMSGTSLRYDGVGEDDEVGLGWSIMLTDGQWRAPTPGDSSGNPSRM